MIRCMAFKLSLSDGGAGKLLDTMRDYKKAFDVSAKWGFENQSWNKVKNHIATYQSVRESTKLPSSLLQGARDCACEALKAVKCKVLPNRKLLSAIRYNHRVITINLQHGIATIATIRGRIKANFWIPKCYEQYIGWEIKSSNIIYRENFYLYVSVERSSPAIEPNFKVLGIDRGIRNIAVCSDASFFNSSKVKNVRARYAKLRSELQSKGTRSAKRKLRMMSGRERRFVTDVNHCIAKAIVVSNYSVFALEDLNNIRVLKKRSTEFNRKLNNWSYYQFEQFLRYKAESIGKQVVLVDPRYTSQKCSRCGYTYKGNRVGTNFCCRKCGHKLDADLNAARNIAQAGISGMGRLCVNQPNVTCL